MTTPEKARGGRRVGALDGLRGLAVLSVLLFHGGVPWAQGGFLGVEAFFVLSGFLITSLLITEWRVSGTISLRAFWGRRARRLLPALVCVVVACCLYERAVGVSDAVPGFGADALSTLLYLANWHQIWSGSGYFAEVGLVSPLQHTWSLAIEEQFYLLWPLVVVAVLRRKRALEWLLGLCAAGAAASALEMALLFHGGSGLDRVYYGTDTRAQGLLVGATLAVVIAMLGRTPALPEGADSRPARALEAAGALGVTVLLAAVVLADGTSSWLYDGGLFGVDLAVAAVIAAAVSAGPGPSPVGALLEVPPLRWLGTISYGVYLWHFPLFLWLTASDTGVAGTPLLLLRMAATVAAATLSYFVVEQPVRLRLLRGMALRAATSSAAALTLACVSIAWAADVAAAPTRLPARGLAAAPLAPGEALPGQARACIERLAGTGSAPPFDHCPVVSALVVGDSIGLTLGMQLSFASSRYGVHLDDDAQLGCGFVTSGESDTEGTGYGAIYPACLRAIELWRQAELRDHAGVVVVEMGYWDEAQWLQEGRQVHLGEAGFDAEVRGKMVAFVEALLRPGVPVVLLSVPWVRPPAWPDGSPPPQESAARHDLINAMLESVARQLPGRVYYFDLSPYVTPGNRFEALVAGDQCRTSDGIHFYVGSAGAFTPTRCGAALQEALLPYLRGLVFRPTP